MEEKNSLKSLMLLTMKPVIYAANVSDSDLARLIILLLSIHF